MAEGKRRKPSGRRIVALACVVALHLALAVYVSLPPTPATRAKPEHVPSVPGVVQARLIEVHAEPVPPMRKAVPRGRHAEPAPTTRADRHAPSRRPTRAAAGARAHPPQPADAPLDLTLPVPGESDGQVHQIGRTLKRRGSGARPRLPGGEHVRGAPRFHMIDPRNRGVAGLVRGIQGLFGAVDARCVDVDTWRAMSRRERLARHISDAKIERTARRHGCVPPVRHEPTGIPDISHPLR